MRTLLVAPVEQGSGEIVTCLHVAENLTAQGHDVQILGSELACRYLAPRFAAQLQQLTRDGAANFACWEQTLSTWRPDAVIFADYPLLHFGHGTTPLLDQPGWQRSLDATDACLITFDHFGFAQEEMGLFFGPPHLSFFYQKFPAIPERMRIMLPCPMHEPGDVEGRRGAPFRYWDVPLAHDDEVRQRVRARYLTSDDQWLIVHSVPNWAWRQAEAMGLPFYSYLGAMLDEQLRDLPRHVTVVSVNNGLLLKTPVDCGITLVNLEPLPTAEFQELLFAADLVLTENSVSLAMGKAICGLTACAALVNSRRLPDLITRCSPQMAALVLEMEEQKIGTVYPFRVYPTSMIAELDRLVLYRDNSLLRGFREIELFGGTETREALRRLLEDPHERSALRAGQQEYITRLSRLGDAAAILEELVADERSSRVGR